MLSMMISNPNVREFYGAQLLSGNTAASASTVIRTINDAEEELGIGSSHYFTGEVEMKTLLSTYCCFSGSVVSYLRGEIVDQQQKPLHTCKHCSNDSESVNWVFPLGTFSDRVDQPGALFNGNAKFRKVISATTKKISITDGALPLGSLESLKAS